MERTTTYYILLLITREVYLSFLSSYSFSLQIMLAILIGLLTILTWHFTRVYTTKSINGLAYELRFELLQRPILRMWNILNSTVEITMAQVKLSEYVIGHYGKPRNNTHSEVILLAFHIFIWCMLHFKITSKVLYEKFPLISNCFQFL